MLFMWYLWASRIKGQKGGGKREQVAVSCSPRGSMRALQINEAGSNGRAGVGGRCWPRRLQLDLLGARAVV